MSLAKNSSVYLISNIISSAIPFLLLPILTRVLTKSEFGEIAIFQVMVTVLMSIVGLNSYSALSIKYYECKKNGNELELREYVSSCLFVMLVSVLFIGGAVFLFPGLSFLIPMNNEWLYVAIIISANQFIIQMRLTQWQVRSETVSFGKLQILQSVLNVSFSIAFVISFKMQGDGRVLAILLASLLISLLSLYYLYKDGLIFLGKVDSIKVIEVVRFGLPLVPHVLATAIILYSDRFVIEKYMGLEAVGIYMVAFQLSLPFQVIFDAINKAYSPWLFSVLIEGDERKKNKIVKNTYKYFSFLLLIGGASVIVLPDLAVWVAGDGYDEILIFFGVFCMARIFHGMYLTISNYYFYAKNTKALSYISILSGFCHVLAMIPMVINFGLVGAAWTWLFSNVFKLIITWCFSMRVYDMPWLGRVK